MAIPDDDLQRLTDLCDRDLYLDAYEIAVRHRPFHEWAGAQAKLLAAGLVWHLGAQRLSHTLVLRAFREDRNDPRARCQAGRVFVDLRGPLDTWRFLEAYGVGREEDAALRARGLALRARVAGTLRDFDTAEAALEEAERVVPRQAALAIERGFLFEQQDRYDDAVLAARDALSIEPNSPAAICALAHTLTLVDRDDEAFRLLLGASKHTQCAIVLVRLAVLQQERGDADDAWGSLDRVVELAPMMEKPMARWLAATRSEVAYARGDVERTIEWARLAEDPFHGRIAERLLDRSRDSGRARLAVAFVRQHHMTCAPATLSAIGRFWSKSTNHLEVAEEICYDGTPAWSERSWAERNGWIAREFTVTQESAAALVDRGVPFTLTTTGARINHLQAVIGYDRRRGTLLIRDPYHPVVRDLLVPEFLEASRSTGPRGMALVPAEEGRRLQGVDLPDAALWDRLHHVQTALSEHDRPRAYRAYRELAALDPAHLLVLRARLALAAYDGDRTGVLTCTEELLRLFPADSHLLLSKLSCLRELARRDERLSILERICADKGGDPVLIQTYAQELSEDAREHPNAIRLLRRSVRRGIVDATTAHVLGHVAWTAGRFEESVRHARFAACLADTNEEMSVSFFRRSCCIGQVEAALGFLEGRVARFSTRSGQPAVTLFRALDSLGRKARAFEVLEASLGARPEDADVLLVAADAFARHGDLGKAEELLARAQSRSKRTAWLRAAAHLAELRGDLPASLGTWREVLAAEPSAVDANGEVARLLVATAGRADAREHLRGATERFPHSVPLQRLWIEWLAESNAEETEAALRHLIEVNPVDAWARGHLAVRLGERGVLPEAFAEAEIALLLNPSAPWPHYVLGKLLAFAQRKPEAGESQRSALRRSVDFTAALSELMSLSATAGERRDALAFVQKELVRQTLPGNTLAAYQEHARAVFLPDELLASLREVLAERSDLPQAWAAVLRQLTDTDRLDEAAAISEQAIARFPLEPRLWIDRAAVCRLRSDHEGERAALEHAVRIAPGWAPAVRELSEMHFRSGDPERSRDLLERAVAVDPLDQLNHGWLADALSRLGRTEEAVGCLERALHLESSYEWAWNTLRALSEKLRRPDRLRQFARDLARERSGKSEPWLKLAEILDRPDEYEERLAAIDRAVALEPRRVDAHDLRAVVLAQAGRFDDALAACAPEIFQESPPTPLLGRAAWVLAARGDLRQAMARMNGILAENPGYSWGWRQLAVWQERVSDLAGYLSSAERLEALSPLDPIAHGYVAHARLLNEQREGAKASLRRAIELDPGYTVAGLMLLDAQMADDEIDGAVRTLALFEGQFHGPGLLSRAARLAAKRMDREEATARLRELCFCEDADEEMLEAASKAFRARWRDDAEKLFDELVSREDVNPLVGALWVESRTVRREWRACERGLRALRDGGAVRRLATKALVEAHANANEPWRLRRFVQRRGEELRQDALLWGAVLYAFAKLRRWKAGARWARGWEGRDGLETWMLANLAVCFRAAGQDEDAARASRWAVAHGASESADRHVLWLALDEAANGHADVASIWLGKVATSPLDAYDNFLDALVRATIEIREAPTSARKKEAFERAAEGIRKAVRLFPWFAKTPDLRRAYRRCIRRIARDRGGAVGIAWYLRSLV